MPTFKIDGKPVSFEPGDTILRAAYRAGIDIPYYCWHPGLSVAANCRMCLVEIAPPAGRSAMMLDVLEFDQASGKYVKTQKPKLQPACQVPAAENMEVLSDTSPHVLRARHAVQELLLLNHPVDCPICDQAGNCKLQDYWMQHMTTPKRMHDEIVHKPKAMSLGPTIMYDTERCILCTRCIRFCNEIAKDPVLSLRERGNVTEVNLSPGRQLDHPYSLMVEQVCPVGAMTSKDFRFKARVWFLRSANVVCQTCATGCSAYLDYDPRCQRAYRFRPRENQQVNGHWMCDEGMLGYRKIHENRIGKSRISTKPASTEKALQKVVSLLSSATPDTCAVVLNAKYSCEDNFAIAQLGQNLGISKWFVAAAKKGDDDTILRHEDKNPNTEGILLVLRSFGIESAQPVSELPKHLQDGSVQLTIMLGEITSDMQSDEHDEINSEKSSTKSNGTLIALASVETASTKQAQVVVAVCGWAEAQGVYVNAKGLGQRSERALSPIDDAQPAWKVAGKIAETLSHTTWWHKLSHLRELMATDARLSKVLKDANVIALQSRTETRQPDAETSEASQDG